MPLANEYPQLGGNYEVIHHTQLLARLIADGRLTPVTPIDEKITYHDPCFLGRHNRVFTAPREIMENVPGVQAQEMHRCKERGFCCGAGGARMWMEERIGKRINDERIDEALATNPDTVSTACPFCLVMLGDAIGAKQGSGEAAESLEVVDVAQLLARSVARPRPPWAAPGAHPVTAVRPAPLVRPTPQVRPVLPPARSRPPRPEPTDPEVSRSGEGSPRWTRGAPSRSATGSLPSPSPCWCSTCWRSAAVPLSYRLLLDAWPQYAAYVVSFLTIGIMWLNHHTMLSLVSRVDRITLVLNTFLLMGVVAVPFPTALVADHLAADAPAGRPGSRGRVRAGPDRDLGCVLRHVDVPGRAPGLAGRDGDRGRRGRRRCGSARA